MRTELPKLWHVVVTGENQKVLSKWRGSDRYIDEIVGVCYENGSKGHNPKNDIRSPGGSFDFGEEITFEEFKTLVLGESINTEPNYEIY